MEEIQNLMSDLNMNKMNICDFVALNKNIIDHEQILKLLETVELCPSFTELEKMYNENEILHVKKTNFQELCSLFIVINPTIKSDIPNHTFKDIIYKYVSENISITDTDDRVDSIFKNLCLIEIGRQMNCEIDTSDDMILEDDSDDESSEDEFTDDEDTEDKIFILDINREIDWMPEPRREWIEPDIVKLHQTSKNMKIFSLKKSTYYPYERNIEYIKVDDLIFTPVLIHQVQDCFYRNVPMCIRRIKDKVFEPLAAFNTSKFKYQKDKKGFLQIVENGNLFTLVDKNKGIWKSKDASFQLLKFESDQKRLFMSYKTEKKDCDDIIIPYSTIKDHSGLFSGKFSVMFFNLDSAKDNRFYDAIRFPERIFKFHEFEGMVTECFVTFIRDGLITVNNSKKDVNCECYGNFKLLQDSYYTEGKSNTGCGNLWYNEFYIICLTLKW